MKNFFFDYKRIWLQIQDCYYEELEEIDGDLMLMVCYSALAFILILMTFLMFCLCISFLPLFIIVYIILKLFYLYPIWHLYEESKQHGKAFINHKIFKKLKKCLNLPWDYKYDSFSEKITEINLNYNGQKYNVGFFDFVEIYNLSIKQILRKRILKTKKALNKVTRDKNQIKQKEKLNTQILYDTLLHDIEKMKNNKGE